ncbi:MAG: O-GlcNAc transferase [Planctomycetaceae bacterium]|nr:O-GlcNAc transferase [Planctomycetaceae bacterium]MDP7277095.1 hypothetical protein [Planctomycetaceae bacterium]
MAGWKELLRGDPRVAAGVLVLLVVCTYLPALSGDFLWDDDAHVTDSRPVVEAAGLAAIWIQPGSVPQYYPLTHTSFWLEYRLWSDRPLGYHAVNILLHAGSAVLLWRVLLGLGLPGAWLAAALFAVHPVHVESVAWISERKNTLSGLFCLAAAGAWLRWWRAEPGTARRWWWGSLGLFLAALLSKTVTGTLPAALLVVAWWQTGRIGRREWLGVLPLIALAVPLGVLTIWMEHQHIGAGRLDLDLSLLDRLLIAGRACWFYAGKLAWPVGLAFIYPRWLVDVDSPVDWCYPLAAAATIAGLWWSRGRIGRGPLAVVLLFAGTLTPALGFVDVYPMQFSFVADHFQYLASIAVLVGVAWIVATRTDVVYGTILVVGMAVLSWQQCGIYHDRETLWRDTVAKNPGSSLAQTSLGNELGSRGAHVQAERRHRAAIAIDSTYADAWTNLAVELNAQGRDSEALEAAREAVRQADWLPVARLNLALGLAAVERYDEAVAQLHRAVDLDERFVAAWVQLARVEWLRNDPAAANQAIQQLRQLDPALAQQLGRELAREQARDR